MSIGQTLNMFTCVLFMYVDNSLQQIDDCDLSLSIHQNIEISFAGFGLTEQSQPLVINQCLKFIAKVLLVKKTQGHDPI